MRLIDTSVAARIGDGFCCALVCCLLASGCFRSGAVPGTQGGEPDGDCRPDGGGRDTLPADLDGAVGGDEGGQLPVETVELLAPFAEVYPGQTGVPLGITLTNAADHGVELYGFAVDFSRDSQQFAWWPARRMPLVLPASTTTTVMLYLGIDAAVPLGPVEINATALLVDPGDGVPFVAGPAQVPASLVVVPAPELLDSDGDGLTDLVEVAIGANPNDPDSDNDGLTDLVEAPNAVPIDSDDDGTPDLLEDDSDGGGEPDLLEWRRGSQPTVPTDDLPPPTMTVTDTSDTLDPGTTGTPVDPGPTVSLREALTMAAIRPGPDRIAFSATVFATPQTIEIVGQAPAPDVSWLPEITDDDTLVDGLETVTVHLDTYGKDPAVPLLRIRGARASLRNITVDLTPSAAPASDLRDLKAIYADGALAPAFVALRFSNRYAGSGHTVGVAIYAHSSSRLLVHECAMLRGSGAGIHAGLDLWSASEATVRHSRIHADSWAIYLDGMAGSQLIANELASGTEAIFMHGGSNHTLIRGNHVQPSGGGGGIGCNWACNDNLIELNLIHNCAASGIAIPTNSTRNTIRQNSITQNAGAAISIQAGAQDDFAAPTITAVTVANVSGTHPAEDGTVIEVFADPEDEAEVYLGSTELQGGLWQLDLARPVPLAYSVTATATSLAGSTSELSAAVPAYP